MNEHKNGGPAFPGGELPEHPNHPVGMSLRDWFAGQAISGVIEACKRDTIPAGETPESHFAIRAYMVADAMLAARKQEDAQ